MQHTSAHTLGKLTTLQLIVITIPVAIAEARQFQAGAVVAFALKVATLGRNGIVTCTEREGRGRERGGEWGRVSRDLDLAHCILWGYLQLLSSDLSPAPQSYSPSHSQARGMHFKLLPQ